MMKVLRKARFRWARPETVRQHVCGETAVIMASNDIGIDLGTATVIIYDPNKGLILKEPSVVAINVVTDEVICVGEEANQMIGKTPDRIRAMMPLSDGVISDFDITREMIRIFLKKVSDRGIIKPRVAICVPSGITDVESRAVVSAAVSAGARKVYLIEEPVAAALGAGIDISKPEGNVVLDIGGGTSDIAVLSFNGVVRRGSIKVAGRKMDQAIVKYIRQNHSVLIGERMAEKLKIEIGSVMMRPGEDKSMLVKGRNLLTGLPVQFMISRGELVAPLTELAMQIIGELRRILEVTPPELAADIHHNGLVMTGGGSLLDGMDRLIERDTGIAARLAQNPAECVAIGTALAFQYLDKLYDGFLNPSTHSH
jgi:rod shape-determining protein MreB